MSTLQTTNLKNPSSASNNIVLDSSARVLVGTASARSNFYNSAVTSKTQIEYNDGTFTAGFSCIYSTTSSAGGEIILGKTGSSSIGGNTLVAFGDTAGVVSFQASDGSELLECASIRATIDGTPGANDMPARLAFSTTADGASSPTERLRISSTGAQSSVIPGGSTLYPSFDCRAWVNFNGQGSVAIRGSGNVSSITDNGTGDYTVNFTTAMPDTSYAPIADCNWDDGSQNLVTTWRNITTSSCRVRTVYGINSVNYDALGVFATIFR